ncbi:MAG: response regulator transcription factor [Polyangia bacterium]
MFIVDDHPLFRLGLASILRSEGTFNIVGEAEDGPEALEMIRRGGIDVVMLDVSLKTTSGLELLKTLKSEMPQLPVLIMSMHDDSLYAERAMRAGAGGYLMKDAPAPQVIETLRKVIQGNPGSNERFVQRRSSRANVSSSPELNPDFEMALLSDRELEVLEAIGRGFSTRECAERLHVSIKTIEAHQAHIKAKLKLQDANRLRRFAAVWVARERPLPLDHAGSTGSHAGADAPASAPSVTGGEGGDHAGTASASAPGIASASSSGSAPALGSALPNVQAAQSPSGTALPSDKTPGQAN